MHVLNALQANLIAGGQAKSETTKGIEDNDEVCPEGYYREEIRYTRSDLTSGGGGLRGSVKHIAIIGLDGNGKSQTSSGISWSGCVPSGSVVHPAVGGNDIVIRPIGSGNLPAPPSSS